MSFLFTLGVSFESSSTFNIACKIYNIILKVNKKRTRKIRKNNSIEVTHKGKERRRERERNKERETLISSYEANREEKPTGIERDVCLDGQSVCGRPCFLSARTTSRTDHRCRAWLQCVSPMERKKTI